MAKKLRKRMRSPLVLMVELLIPWAVMGVCALVLLTLGQPEVTIYGVSLIAALGVTVLIHAYENTRRRRRRPPG